MTSSEEDDEKVEADQFYDDKEDDGIEKEINELQGSEQVGNTRLSCPCCFTTICNDCQRHSRKKSQWRAMFVVNCSVGVNKETDSNELLSVTCDTCGASLGVQDAEEVYHFFGVVPSL